MHTPDMITDLAVMLLTAGLITILFKKIKKSFKKVLTKKNLFDIIKEQWEFSSAGRASALQAEGHRFEPYNSHQNRIRTL